MRHKLVFSAAETVAFQNAAGQRNTLLPVKSLHVVVAWLDPKADFELCGSQVAEIHGRWRSRSNTTVPYDKTEPYRVAEPVCLKSGLPRADDLKTAWLGGQSEIKDAKTRQSRPEETRFTAYVEQIELIRLKSLTTEQLAQCGVRETVGGWSHGDSGVLFPTATLAFSDHWDAHFPDTPWEINPWAWALHLDEPVVHVSEKETLQQAGKLLKKFQKNQIRLERMERAASQFRAEQRKTEQQVCRVLRTHCADRNMDFGDYTAHLDMAYLSKNTRVAQNPLPAECKETA